MSHRDPDISETERAEFIRSLARGGSPMLPAAEREVLKYDEDEARDENGRWASGGGGGEGPMGRDARIASQAAPGYDPRGPGADARYNKEPVRGDVVHEGRTIGEVRQVVPPTATRGGLYEGLHYASNLRTTADLSLEEAQRQVLAQEGAPPPASNPWAAERNAAYGEEDDRGTGPNAYPSVIRDASGRATDVG